MFLVVPDLVVEMKRLLNRPAAVAQNPGETVTVYNCGRQKVGIQVSPPGGDFFLSEQQIHLFPGKSVQLQKEYLRWEQISNLRSRREIEVTHDSEIQN